MDKREEILDNKPSQKGGNGSKFYNRTVVLKAMSEYAQLESIEFKNWCDDEGYRKSDRDKNKYYKPSGKSVLLDYYTTSELYQIFKQEQQTTK